MPDNHPDYLSPSELGTKDYWETFYARTLTHLSSKSKPGAIPTPTAPESENGPDNETEDESENEEEVDDDTDPGTSWFTEHKAPEKILSFLTAAEFPFAPCNTLPRQTQTQTQTQTQGQGMKAQPSILDLGTGNGSMLALLRTRGGFRGDMVGVDYSEKSIVLARELQRLRIHSAYWGGSSSSSSSESGDGVEKTGKIYADGEARDKEEDNVVVAGASNLPPPNTAEAIPVPDGDDAGIRFEVWDILAQDLNQIAQLDWFPRAKDGFDIVLDKGTFDAVSLSDERVDDGERVCERYPGIARALVRKGGFLVVTSCNWTEEELVKWFTADGGLRVWGRVEYPRFRFGGREGQGVCTVCFQRPQ